ncbi:hypothetical protein AA101099_0433 [Neoasaia chiangmaiensis NBRC 101099]|uniref:DNA (cytosine-5-)-methyltransferase n=1 Tax=Neoasaia chiangmaiensis TaxID=320497 RepID=A0A1U9KRM1_9PROT|nr:hypothetical protein A0U93_11510 [Neoasaia chiangmaiensis]GBR36662.1 hypothetical protein AA101099_0433 [Neoasaia chiangmaiensis NBRC 101099]
MTGKMLVGGGPHAVADPRHPVPAKQSNEYRIVPWSDVARCITGAHGTGQCVADPRPNLSRGKGDAYLTAGHYGVVSWTDSTGAVSAAAGHDNGRWAVADPRTRLPASADKLVAVIRSLDGTWHRPFTTAELAALQSLFDPEEQAELDGLNDAAWRERIGNAVPPNAARAIAETMGRTLLAAWSGESFMLSAEPIWVQPIAIAASVAQPSVDL